MLIGAIGQYFFGIAIFLSSTFLILLVLVQRGRGGGLTGALGGAGGQSAFGTKAGDVFTKITVGVAAAWIFLCGAAVFALKSRGFSTGVDQSATAISAPDDDAGMSGTTTPPANEPLQGLPEMPASDSTTEAEVTNIEPDATNPAEDAPETPEGTESEENTGDETNTESSDESSEAPAADDGNE